MWGQVLAGLMLERSSSSLQTAASRRGLARQKESEQAPSSPC